MTTQLLPTRAELHQALRASGVQLDLDIALANPTLARCLALAAEAARSVPARGTTPSRYGDLAALNQRLRRLVGDLDHQQLRAGDTDN